jgi:hypothetical protein
MIIILVSFYIKTLIVKDWKLTFFAEREELPWFK